MNDIILILFLLPVFWFVGHLCFEIFNLFYIWTKSKFDEIKNKETSLWD